MLTSTKLASIRSALRALVALSLGIAIPACSDNSVPPGPDLGTLDGQTTGDSSMRDTGPRPDVGPQRDTGIVVDTGPQIDTGMATDTGVMTPDTGVMTTDTGVRCGNGVVDTGETCDTAIATGAGACATAASCNDGMVCTSDVLQGSACTTMCVHMALTAGPADGCCPTGATPATDPDCVAGCGNGFVDSGETCDTAIAAGTTGACPTMCNDGIACTTDALVGSMCTARCTHTAITTPSGTTADGCCPAGAVHATDTDCPITCGNGVVDSGETCDTAIASGAGTCPTIASCNDGMACTTDSLVSAGTCNAACAHMAITTAVNGDGCCPPGANHNTDTDCAPMCGNGVVEGPGESCDPPAPGTCSATCQTIVAACGDGILQAGEDCDDGNTRNLDGCNSACRYEAFGRLTTLQISTAVAPAMCAHPRNQLGAHALTGTAVGQLNPTLNTDVSNGTLNVLLQALGLVDLNGVNDPAFNLGVMSGVRDPAAGAWPAAGNPMDWRFFIDHNGVDTMGLPTAQMPGAIVARALTAGPANITIPLALGGTVANLVLFNTHAIGTVSMAVSHPTYPASLRATITAWDTIAGNGAGQGLCGDISVGSLAQIPLPAALCTGGGTACGQNYTYCGMGMPVTATCNSLLDALVSGCTVFGFVTAINPTQPDVGAGGGPVVNLTVGAGRHVSNVAANANEAYSGFFTFTANRAHASGEVCTAAAQCQATQTLCSTTATSGANLICH